MRSPDCKPSSLQALLTDSRRPVPSRYELTLFLFDPAVQLLVPVFPPLAGDDEHRTFAPKTGAAGIAWSQGQFTLVEGEAVSDATHGLTEVQQEYFKLYRVVAAVPVPGEDGRPIGVLSAIARRGDGFFDDAAGRALFKELAEVIGVILDNVWDDGTLDA